MDTNTITISGTQYNKIITNLSEILITNPFPPNCMKATPVLLNISCNKIITKPSPQNG
jgi:hypothetical protein